MKFVTRSRNMRFFRKHVGRYPHTLELPTSINPKDHPDQHDHSVSVPLERGVRTWMFRTLDAKRAFEAKIKEA